MTWYRQPKDKVNNLTKWLDTVTFDIFSFQCRGYFCHVLLCDFLLYFYSGVFVFSFCAFYSLLTPGMYVVLSIVWCEGLAVL